MFKGADGKISMMRVLSFFVVNCVMAIFLGHNILSMIHGGGFVSLGYEEASLVALVLGAKAYQLHGEVRSNGNGYGNNSHGNGHGPGPNADTHKPPTTTDLPVDKKE